MQLVAVAVGEGRLNATVLLGDRLLSSTAVSGREAIRQQLTCARTTWNQLSKDIAEHCRQCQEHSDTVKVFTDSLTQLNMWIDVAQNRLSDAEKCSVENLEKCKDQLKTLKVCRTIRISLYLHLLMICTVSVTLFVFIPLMHLVGCLDNFCRFVNSWNW